MGEYIKREDALKIIDNYSKAVTEEGKVVTDAIRDIIAVITPTADVVPKTEVAREIFEEIESEIKLALESNHKAKREHIDKNYYCLHAEFLSAVQGKIDALRGIEGFVEELKKKYTEENKI